MAGLTWIRLHLNPWANVSKFEDVSPSDRRQYILDSLEHSRRREWLWVVVVAGVGFLTDAYNIFAINLVMPMIGHVYYPSGVVPHEYEVAINIATLGGSIIGRRKAYGLELIITVVAALGSAMASNGVNSSMSLIGWLIFWRLIMGIGIGADYPLSAVLCSDPRYTVDIVRDDHQAAIDVNSYFYSGDHLSTRSFDPSQQDQEDEEHIEGVDNAMFQLAVTEPGFSQAPHASLPDIVDYFWHKGNYRTLVATSLSWLSLDLAFYGLGMV
ncbi:inorganic phosphate transporter [Aureobasidium subglaciale]|nr:inorganic phosphate transporter [Aureobasidium subglaciale]